MKSNRAADIERLGGSHLESTDGAQVDDRYLIEGQALGVGGMGVVYRAYDPLAKCHVALKRMLPGRQSDEAHHRQFQREYQTLRQLAHPRIVAVYDYGVDVHGPYYTMELLDGRDAGATAPVDWRQTCAIMRDLACALALIHSRGFVHRDVSGRNVRCTADGRGKLLDFGAMAPFGKPVKAIGTPPFVAPEAIYRQPLDGRTDLFALGALGYLLLSGRPVFDAVDLPGLVEAWRDPPAPLALLAPEVPRVVTSLVMSLVSLSVEARPRSATEVIDKLAAIAGLPSDTQLHAPGSYLNTPVLQGREEALESFRARLRRVKAGKGGSVLWLEGQQGVGRSRVLAEFGLEAQLSGMKVMSLEGHRCADGPFSGARSLIEELLRSFPGVCRRLPRALVELGIGVDSVESSDSRPPALTSPDREKFMQQALLAWFQDVLPELTVMIAVDDVERLDTPSQALVALLARHAHEHRLLIATTTTSLRVNGPLVLLQDAASTVFLPALSEEHMRALLVSVFGEVPGLQRVAQYIQGAARGNARGCMELLQFLVEEGLACHATGSWHLPEVLDSGALPRGHLDAVLARFTALSTAAKDLAKTLALAQPTVIGSLQYSKLLGQGAAQKVRAAFVELETGQVLEPVELGHRFSHDGWVGVALASVLPEERQSLHSNIASALEPRVDPLDHGHHLFCSGLKDEGLDAVVAKLEGILADSAEQQRYSAFLMGQDGAMQRLLPMLAACETSSRPAKDSFIIRLILTRMGCASADEAMVGRYYPTVVAQLKRDSGFDAYSALTGHTEDSERLRRALAIATREHAARPTNFQVFAPAEAIQKLTSLALSLTAIGVACGMARWNDEALSLLKPFVTFSPAIDMIEERLNSFVPLLQGNHLEYRKATLALLERLGRAESGSLPSGTHRLLLLTCTQGSAMMDAVFGLADVSDRASLLASRATHRVNAERLLGLAQLAKGQLALAQAHQARAETLALHNPTQTLDGTFVTVEAWLDSAIGDALGLKPVVRALERRASCHIGWTPAWQVYLGRYQELCGDVEQGILHYERALALMTPGKHLLWAGLVARYTAAQTSAGQVHRAIAFGRDALSTASSLAQGYLWMLEGSLSLAEAHIGEFLVAARRADRVVDFLERAGCSGVVMGNAYETRARIALLAGDAAAVNRYVDLLGSHWPLQKHPALAARHEELLGDVRASTRDPSRGHGVQPTLHRLLPDDSEVSMVQRRLRTHPGLSARCAEAINLILAQTRGREGYIFLLSADSGHLALQQVDGRRGPPAAVQVALTCLVSQRPRASDETLEPDEGEQDTVVARRTVAEHMLQPIILATSGGISVGAVALGQTLEQVDLPGPRFYEAIADCLAEVSGNA